MSTSFKIMPKTVACRQCASWQASGDKVVFTNGCFDLLHAGHIALLESAKALGGRLVVGINSDASVRGLKGPARPVCGQDSRTRVLAALACVDAVVVFEDETPLQLIQTLKPNILVKGGDYTANQVVGAEWIKKRDGEVVIIPLYDVYSTSQLIEKIQKK